MPSVTQAIRSMKSRKARIWVLAGAQTEGWWTALCRARARRSGVEIVLALSPDEPVGPTSGSLPASWSGSLPARPLTVLEECQAWEAGASAVVVTRWPRVVLAAARGVWRRRFYVPVREEVADAS